MSEKIQGHVGIAQLDGNAINLGAGNAGTGTQRVILADDSPGGNVAAIGAVNETAPATDTASSGLNGRLQRIAQRITSLIALIPAALDAFGCFKVGHGKTIKTVSGTLTADGDIIPLVASKRIKVFAYSIFTTGTNLDLAIFKSNGTAGTELWRVPLQSVTSQIMGANLATSVPGFLFATAAGEKLTLDVNQSDTLHYSLSYYDDDAT